MIELNKVDSTTSTSTLMAAEQEKYGHGAVLYCREQTAGRGQRGNSWEAEPGKNLCFSVMMRPKHVAPKDSYYLSMAVSVGLVKALRHVTGLEVELKWPNDVYVGDRKLCGILIENTFSGQTISRSIAGIGINVNQAEFLSDAPNPVSLIQLLGHEFELEPLLRQVCEAIMAEVDAIDNDESLRPELHARYLSMLWRRKGEWLWDDKLRGERIRAAIRTVEPSGTLILDTDPPRSYAFKEVAAVL